MLEQLYHNTKTRFYTDESFLSYFVSKMILLNILQNVAIYLFEYFVSHIAVIHCSATGQIKLPFSLASIMGYPGR